MYYLYTNSIKFIYNHIKNRSYHMNVYGNNFILMYNDYNAQVCVYLTVHITKLQLQTTFPKPLYIPHSACIHWDPGC